MQLARLAQIQKRISDWRRTLTSSACPSVELRERAEQALMALQTLLTRCWKAKIISAEDEATTLNLERALERLSDDARLLVRSHTPILKQETFGRTP